MAKPLVDLKSLARTHTETAVRVLASIMTQAKAPPSARAFAANSILDRGWGRAPVAITGEDGGGIQIIIRQLVDIAKESPSVVIDHEASEDQLALPLSQPNER